MEVLPFLIFAAFFVAKINSQKPSHTGFGSLRQFWEKIVSCSERTQSPMDDSCSKDDFCLWQATGMIKGDKMASPKELLKAFNTYVMDAPRDQKAAHGFIAECYTKATAETGTCDQIDELIACMIAKLDRDHHSDDHDGDDNDKETKEEKKRKKSKG